MSEPVSFAEHSCWNEEDFRHSRKPVVFRLYNVGAGLGRLVNVEFTADFGIWYDQHDLVLMYHLGQAEPNVNWNNYVYYRKWDHSGIEIFDMESQESVAFVEVRKSQDSTPNHDREHLGDNVTRMADWKAARMSNTAHSPEDDVLILELSDVIRGPDAPAE